MIKIITNILLVMFTIAGLMMAGAETSIFFNQMVVCTIGVCVFSAAGYLLYFVNRKK
jgi:protein-S-isoprenylcysteine O-methyltransferase Ste14